MAAKQRQPAADPPEITAATVRRLLELGEILASAFTPGEIEEIQRAYDLWKSASSSPKVTSSALDGRRLALDDRIALENTQGEARWQKRKSRQV